MSLRLGIIGLGRVAHLLELDPLRNKPCTHLGAWSTQPQVELVAACDIDPGKIQQFQKTNCGVNTYSSFDEMLSTEQLDIVSICAYANQRSEMVVRAAQAGIKGIWCEKALASSLQEATYMKDVLAINNTKMIISFMRRWHPRYQLVRSLLEKGVIGRLQSINIHFSGNMMHTGTHAFDIINMLAGKVETVQAWLNTKDARPKHKNEKFIGKEYLEDFGGFALLELNNGVKAVVHGENKGYFRFEFELLGSKGLIRIGNTQQELFCIAESDYSEDLLELKKVDFPHYDNVNHWEIAVADLVNAITTGSSVACGINEGITSLTTALAIHHSHHSGHARVRLDEVPDNLRVASC